MEHINSMTKLREQVAFEGYAQKQPLVVYKEKAFDKFKNLLSEIEYRVVKSIFSIKPDMIIKQAQIRESDLQVNEGGENTTPPKQA
jgi:preprotein translocase subunit SecA